MRKLHMNWKRIIALLCLLILLCMLLSPIHDCVGKDCAICALISFSKSVISLAFLYAVSPAFGNPICRVCALRRETTIHRNDTLVLQKVKLSN